MTPIFKILDIKVFYLFIIIFLLNIKNILNKSHDKNFYFLTCFYLLTCSVGSIVNSSITPLLNCLIYIVTIYVITSLPKIYITKIIDFSTKIMILMIILAWLSIAYSILKFPSLFDIGDIGFYLFSFSKGLENGFLRPSGLYDEPGAFTFFICSLVICRGMVGYRDYKNWILLIGGLVTQSIVQVLFILCYLIWHIKKRGVVNLKKYTSSTFIVLGCAILFFIFFRSSLLEWMVERSLLFINEPLLNPRYRAFQAMLEQLKDNLWAIFFGFDINCINRDASCEAAIFGENILTPLIYGGLVVAWPYYLFLLISPFKLLRFWPLMMGLSIMLLQRPYLLEFSYSATIIFIIITGFFFKNYERKT